MSEESQLLSTSTAKIICRLCLGTQAVIHNIFCNDLLLHKIRSCLPLKVSKDDNLPKIICDSCSTKIADIYEYCNRAKNAEKELLSIPQTDISFENIEMSSGTTNNNNLSRIATVPHQIKLEPLDNNAHEHSLSKYTQTEPICFAKNEIKIKEEILPEILFQNLVENNAEYHSETIDDMFYSSEDDITLNNIMKIPPIKLKIKKEYSEMLLMNKEKKKSKKRKKEESISKKRGRPKGSLNKLKKKKLKQYDHSMQDMCEPEVLIKTEGSENRNANLDGVSNQWQCLTCFSYEKSRTDLLKHYKEHGDNIVKMNLIKNEIDIKDEVSDNEDLKCVSDGKTKFNKYKIVKSKEYESGIAYQCLICLKLFDNKRSILRHFISHEDNRPYICNICGRSYKRAYEILLHGRAHNGVKTLFCTYEPCNYSTVYRGALLTHQRRHEPAFKYTCEICNKGFDVLTWFTEHKNLHTGDKPFSCDICGKNFMYSRYLVSHRKNVHPETNSRKLLYRCDKCNLEFSYRKKLKRHIVQVHEEEHILCDICGKSLSSKEHLKCHKRIHTGEKPYACRTCGKAFVKKCNLTIHEKIHSGDRPHVCSHCGKAFSQRSTLVVHERYHSGARPYRCDVCSKGFVARGLLTVHMRTCSKKNTQPFSFNEATC